MTPWNGWAAGVDGASWLSPAWEPRGCGDSGGVGGGLTVSPGSEPSCSRCTGPLREASVCRRLQDHWHQPPRSSADPQCFQPQPGGDPKGRGFLRATRLGRAGTGWWGPLEVCGYSPWAWFILGEVCLLQLQHSLPSRAAGEGHLLLQRCLSPLHEAASPPGARGRWDLGRGSAGGSS